jgi:basic amino acid/polyamine antiporter, APA family
MAFRRALSTFDATMLVVGGIIGAGIFISPYLVAQRLPSAGLVLGAWVAGGAIAMAGALAFAELAALFPKAGGQYVYLREAYHPLVGFLFGWASLVMIQGGGIAAVAITFSEYALRLVGAPGADARPLAVLSLGVLALVNYVGVKPGSRLLNVLVLLKIGALAVLVLGGLWMAPSLAPAAPAPVGPRPHASLLAFGAALVPILFSYGGWQSANSVAEEMREPRRTLPRALVLGTAIVVVVYVLVNLVYLMTLTRDGLAATATPAADAVVRIFGAGADRWISAAIAVSTFGFLNLSLLAPTRISYAMARDGVFFRGIGRLHPRFGTPHRAILLQALWSAVLVMTGTYGGLVDSVVFADWIFFGLAVAAVIFLRRRIPPEARAPGAFLTPGFPVLPILFVGSAVLVLAGVIRSNPGRAGIGLLLLVAGIPIYLWARSRGRSAGVEP